MNERKKDSEDVTVSMTDNGKTYKCSVNSSDDMLIIDILFRWIEVNNSMYVLL